MAPLNERIERERLAREAREAQTRREQEERGEWEAEHRPPPPSKARDSHVEIESPKGSIRIHAGNVTIKDIIYLGMAITAGITWYQNLANKKYVDDAAAASVTTSASAAASIAAAMLPPVIKEMHALDAKQNRRWDLMDSTSAALKRKPGTPEPPKFGPKAERLGEVKYETIVSEDPTP